MSSKPDVNTKKMMPIVCPAFLAAFGSIYCRVHYCDEESEIKGFGLLLRSGGGETLGNNTYGLSSARQIELLQENNLSFELLG